MPSGRDQPAQQVFFGWTKDIETGFRIIDMDHRLLVKTINQIHETQVSGRFNEEASDLFSILFDYCTEHFFREEKIMAEYGYPGLRVHKERHRGIRCFVFALRVVAVERPSRIDPEKLLLFLRDWLTNHIGKSDMDYVKHINQQLSQGENCPVSIDTRRPVEEITLTLALSPDDTLLLQQVAEILRGHREDALRLESAVQNILARHTFDIPLEDCEVLVKDLLR